MTENPFATAESWDVGGGFLTAGDHICEILEIDGTGTSSGNHPQIEVKVGNAEGEIRDWIVVIPTTIGKVVQLTDAAEIERPSDDEVVPEGTGFRLAPAYLNRLLGKKVGVIVRQEPDRQDPTKMRDRVKGYVPAHKIKPSDVPMNTGIPVAAGGFPGTATSDDDIPFLWDGPRDFDARYHANRGL